MAPTHSHTETHSPLAEGEDHLTALPNELLANVIKRLLVREIARFRSVSRHSRNFVDTNQKQLTQGLITEHHARITGEYKLLTDLSDGNIVDALRRYDAHYSFCRDLAEANARNLHTIRGMHKLDAIAMALCQNWARSSPHLVVPEKGRSAAIMWVTYYSDLSFRNHQAREACLGSIDGMMARLPALSVSAAGSTDVDTLRASLRCTITAETRVPYAVIPTSFLIPRCHFTAYNLLSQAMIPGR